MGIPRKFTPKAGFILINVFLLYRTLISIFDSNVSGMLPEGDFYCDFYLIFLPCHLYSSSMFFHDSLTNIKPQPAASLFLNRSISPVERFKGFLQHHIIQAFHRIFYLHFCEICPHIKNCRGYHKEQHLLRNSGKVPERYICHPSGKGPLTTCL